MSTPTTISTTPLPPVITPRAVPIWPPVIYAYHATRRETADKIVSTGKYEFWLAKSDRGTDWHGDGVYLFPSLSHAIRWAKLGLRKWDWENGGAVVGLTLRLGNCLDLTSYRATDVLVRPYVALADMCKSTRKAIPKNSRTKDGIPMDRYLDCAVLNTLNNLSRMSKRSKRKMYDTIICAHADGKPPYPGSAFRTKTHIQIAVTNQECFSKPFLAWPST